MLGNRYEKLGKFGEGETKVINKEVVVFYPGVYQLDNFRVNNAKKESFTNLNANEENVIVVNGK